MRSGCNSRPTGAVIVVNNKVIATGYNGSLPGQFQCTDKGRKYCYRREVRPDDTTAQKHIDCLAVHAEQNALNQLCNSGAVDLTSATIYCTLFPCKMCLQNLISVGIRRIRFELNYNSAHPEHDSLLKEIMTDNHLDVKQIRLDLLEVTSIANTIACLTSERKL
jgi:dCMP deaminase